MKNKRSDINYINVFVTQKGSTIKNFQQTKIVEEGKLYENILTLSNPETYYSLDDMEKYLNIFKTAEEANNSFNDV